MIKRLVPFSIFVSLLIGCDKPVKNKFTYFGGKIIHPKDSIVLLTNSEGFRDTLKLTKENTFMGKYENFNGGLYYFRHGNEHQYAYIQPNDSLIFRLNTWDFDESLVFSGKGADMNNLLMEAFLKHEEEDRLVKIECKAKTDVFVSKMDSILDKKKELLANFKQENQLAPKEFIDIYNVALTYPVYSSLEKFTINNCTRFESDSVKNNILKHREEIQLGRDSLMFYGPYYSYVTDKMYGEAVLKGYKEDSEDFVIDLLQNFDKEIKDEKIKNSILYRTVAYNFIKRVKNNENKKVFFNYFKLSTDIEDKKEIQRLINDINYIEDQKNLPEFKVEAPTGNWVDITDLLQKKNTVIYFNNSKYFSDDMISSRFNFLKKTYPKVNFIIIQQNKNKKSFVKGIDIKYQYKLMEGSKAYDFLTSNFPRLIIVDKFGVVKNKFSSLFAFDIEGQLKGL